MQSLDPLLSPARFEWGCATSAFQIEGASTANGKVPSIWDSFCAESGRIRDGNDGSVACDHFHRFADDVKLMADLGLRHYRFSIAWPRITRADNTLNAAGLDFYKRLLDALEHHGITPNATLFHWDLPAHLSGGWLNRETAYRFADYAELIARHLGDRLPRVATLNEPWCSAFLGYDLGVFAPGVQDRAQSLVAAHHLMLAHGLGLQAWRAVRSDTMLGIVLNPELCDPATPDGGDAQAARMAELERNDCFLNPLFGQEWPEELIHQIGPHAHVRHAGDTAICAQQLDFMGLNYYTRSIAQAPQSVRDKERGYTFVPPQEPKPLTDIGWEIYPEGLTRVVQNLLAQWPLPALWITENGAADNTEVAHGSVDDGMRCDYLRAHFAEVARLRSAGVDIRGYYVWSLLDNFEWAHGYSQRFGIVHVDFATQKRTPKRSALMLQGWLRA
ncbi:GH1 family beta-glucosidase [Rhodoferax sp. OV413]|uniref:GH1 family beta-glucosidase n=1 Tax=Rhodoferax sp. OV413 TaxID=1855285 RepID=UPI0025F90864|nr:GH1 family beta-glucosidase [Rhodoferax sp. OV413]